MVKVARPNRILHLKLTIQKDPEIKYLKILQVNSKHNRSSISMTESKGVLFIEINAKDATALRASANSILRDLQVIEATKLPGKS